MTNTRTRSLRRNPTARSIPSSDFRSSASITKMLTSNRMPASTANDPIARNSWRNESPKVSALSSTSCLTGRRSTPSTPARPASSCSITASLRSALSITPPVAEIKTRSDGGCACAAAEPPSARRSATVLAATNAFIDVVS